jgi:hypothetical protein
MLLGAAAWEGKHSAIPQYAQVCYLKVKEKYLPVESMGANLSHSLAMRESWAALIHARDANFIPPEKLTSPIIVIGINSSIIDITTYIKGLQVADVEGKKDTISLLGPVFTVNRSKSSTHA